MQFRISREPLTELTADGIIIFYFKNQRKLTGSAAEADRLLEHQISRLVAEGEVRGELAEVTILHTWGKLAAKRVIILGLGESEKLNMDRIRKAIAVAARKADSIGIKELAIGVTSDLRVNGNEVDLIQAFVEAVCIGLYRFAGYQKERAVYPKHLQALTIVVGEHISEEAAAVGLERGEVLSHAVNMARDWINEPANKFHPSRFAEVAVEVGKRRGIQVEVLEEEDLKRLGMGALLAVAQGSDQPAKMVVMRYQGAPESTEWLGYVGKGITFDTGGIQVKPDKGMGEMKGDMAGGAAVIAAMDAIGALRPHVNVLAVIPICENMISGSGYRPSDVIESFSGKTIEVGHTDAEGRLILADGVAYAKYLGATHLVDIATLTGSVISALGHVATGIMGNEETMIQEVKKAAELAGEKVWELPMFEEYEELLKSEIADIKNEGGSGAGAVQGAKFIQAFVGDTPWVHMDIAGTADCQKDDGLYCKGATGAGVRTLIVLAVRRGS